MYEEALRIHDYLPIRKGELEEKYISHLWNVFFTLDGSNEIAQPFMIMPFHLLFMTALQYKVLRISKELANNYNLAFTLRHIRNHEKLCSPISVFDFSLLNERTLPDLFRLIDLDESLIQRIKELIDYRNENLAHANGGIELKFEEKIMEYLDCLNELQNNFVKLNNEIAENFIEDMSSDDDKSEFIDTRLYGSYLSPADFKSGSLKEYFGMVGSYI